MQKTELKCEITENVEIGSRDEIREFVRSHPDPVDYELLTRRLETERTKYGDYSECQDPYGKGWGSEISIIQSCIARKKPCCEKIKGAIKINKLELLKTIGSERRGYASMIAERENRGHTKSPNAEGSLAAATMIDEAIRAGEFEKEVL